MLVTASASNPPTPSVNFHERIEGMDRGIVSAWLIGLKQRETHPDLAAKAAAGELPILPFRGGVEKELKIQNKVGSLWYVAAWHGLRGEDLHLDTEQEIQLICSKTCVPILYTLDPSKLFSGGVNNG